MLDQVRLPTIRIANGQSRTPLPKKMRSLAPVSTRRRKLLLLNLHFDNNVARARLIWNSGQRGIDRTEDDFLGYVINGEGALAEKIESDHCIHSRP